METNFKVTIGRDGLPQQEFNGEVFRLYPGERYFSRGRSRMHTKVWVHYFGNIPKGYQIHHKNGNKWDNRIENLEILPALLHQKEHGKRRAKENPEWFEQLHKKGIQKAKEWHKSD